MIAGSIGTNFERQHTVIISNLRLVITCTGTWSCPAFATELPPSGANGQLSASVPRSGRSSWQLHMRRGRPSVSNQWSATTVF